MLDSWVEQVSIAMLLVVVEKKLVETRMYIKRDLLLYGIIFLLPD